ncbi:hypothetical protein RhiirA1_542990 [Rhizophagus irregularis]|uniref:BACK domain-containing protein n=1 Tax=Rhizophagus irregularis TaxID=588596 RepID=A0A2N0QST1_9GLOM|nr:hypothetical protein RhiirA1_542990 [Rhizophagus irregularis]
MVAASELNLQELVIYTQSFLINYKADWMEQNFSLVYQTSFENDSFLELQKFCTDLMSKNPDKIFKSLDFSSIPEKILISLIQIDDLKMNEIKVWENVLNVLKWGLAQNPELSSDPSNYSKDDFNSLKNTLQQCIPFIRFYNLTSKEFSDNILPYKEILPEELFTDLLRNFLNLHPDSKVNHKSKPRIAKEGTPTSTTIDDEREIENSTFSWDNRKPVSLGHIDEWRTNPKPISLNERFNPWNRSWSKVAKSNPRPTSSDEKSNPRPISSILLDDNSSRSSSWNKIANNPSPISSDGWSKPKSILLDDNSSRSSSWNKVAKSNLSPISSDGWSKPKSILLDDNNSRSSSWSKVAKSNLNPISSDDDDWFKRK